MKNKSVKLLACLSASAVILSACGNDDGPGKINNNQETQKKKESKKSSSDDKGKKVSSHNDYSDTKSEKAKKKQNSPQQKIRDTNDKNDERVDNNEKNLPDKYREENAQLMLKDIGYVSVANDGKKKEDITDYLAYNNIENNDAPADKDIYEKVEKNFEKAYPKVKDLVDMDDASKESDKRKEVINDYFYRNDENFDYIYNFAQNGWKPDYDTLDITEADEDNIYVWQMSFKNKDGKKVGSLMGNYYDYVDSIDIIEGGLTNQGAINACDHSLSDYSKGGKK